MHFHSLMVTLKFCSSQASRASADRPGGSLRPWMVFGGGSISLTLVSLGAKLTQIPTQFQWPQKMGPSPQNACQEPKAQPWGLQEHDTGPMKPSGARGESPSRSEQRTPHTGACGGFKEALGRMGPAQPCVRGGAEVWDCGRHSPEGDRAQQYTPKGGGSRIWSAARRPCH